MAYEHSSGSADGRFALLLEVWEARNTHWVASPQLCNASNAKVLFQPERTWSVDGAAWAGAQLRVVLSKFPGGQTRPTLATFIDCEREVARVEEGCEVPLGALEPELNRFLLRAR